MMYSIKPSSGQEFPEDYFIIDVGMNDGKDAEYYSKRGFRVIAYEANPALADEGGQRLRELGYDVEVRNKAISDQQGELNFYVNHFNHRWSSLDPKLGKRRKGADEIRVMSCDLRTELHEICERIHYVKIDIEGFDYIALQQVLELPHLPPYISVENGRVEMVEALVRAGFTRFKYSNQKYVPTQRIPNNSSHGHKCNHEFIYSSSGLFGEDISGRWFTAEETVQVSKCLMYGRSNAPDNLWAACVGHFDLHAALPLTAD